MDLLKGKSRLERAAIGGLLGSAINTGLHAVIRGGSIVQPVMDQQKAFTSLGAEGAVALLTGILTKSTIAGAISGATGLLLFIVDLASVRGVAPGVPLVSTPTTPAPAASAPKTSSTNKVIQTVTPFVPAIAKLFEAIPGLFGVAPVQPDLMVVGNTRYHPGKVTTADDAVVYNAYDDSYPNYPNNRN